MELASRWLGRVEYKKALAVQKAEAVRVQNGPGVILGCEHPPTITLGKRANAQAELLSQPSEIASQIATEIAIEQTDRGGFATLHSPGQLVIYPILPLRALQIGAREYVQSLLTATQEFLMLLGVQSSERPQAPGLYTENGKILFVGVRIENGISRHGIALNVSNDLSLFNLIRSCGKDGEQFDHLQTDLSLKELFSRWSEVYVDYLRSNSRKDC